MAGKKTQQCEVAPAIIFFTKAFLLYIKTEPYMQRIITLEWTLNKS